MQLRSLIGTALVALVLPMVAMADAREDANKKTVTAFYEAAINQKDFAAASKFLGSKYVQHNPKAADGADGLKSFLAYMKDKSPKSHSEIKKVYTDGDVVVLHVHAVREPGTLGQAIIDIFRLENGKIVEHWDVIQDITDKPANTNGMF